LKQSTGRTAGRLTIIGTGPGDPELLTLKALKAVEQAQAIVAPTGRPNGASSALEIIAQAADISGKQVVEVHFSMQKVRLSGSRHRSVEESWSKAADTVLEFTGQGMNVVFPTIGDPAFYSTAYYLLSTVQERQPGLVTEVIPGISSVGSCSSALKAPLALGDDMLCIIPATFGDDRIRQAIETFDSIALMKVHRCLPRVIRILEEYSLLENAVLVEKCALDGERIFQDIRKAAHEDLHYFSTVIVRKQRMGTAGRFIVPGTGDRNGRNVDER